MAHLRAFAVVLAVAVVATGADAQIEHAAFLQRHAGFSAADVRRVEAGETLARPLAADATEAAIGAATIIHIPIAVYLRKFEQIESFKRGPEVLRIGRLSPVPSPGDMAALMLDQPDLSALRECVPGDCGVKLDAIGIRRLTAPGIDVHAVMRAHLAEYAARYVREGNASLIEYANEHTPVRLASELQHIMRRSPYLQQAWPDIAGAVADFRGSLSGELRHFIYWAKEKPVGRSVVSLTHAIIRPEADGVAVIATKQLYASHYLTASLGTTILINRGTPESPRTLVVYINRTRVDMFDGVLGRVKRPIVRSRARTTAEQMLRDLRTRLEAEFRTGG